MRHNLIDRDGNPYNYPNDVDIFQIVESGRIVTLGMLMIYSQEYDYDAEFFLGIAELYSDFDVPGNYGTDLQAFDISRDVLMRHVGWIHRFHGSTVRYEGEDFFLLRRIMNSVENGRPVVCLDGMIRPMDHVVRWRFQQSHNVYILSRDLNPA